MSAERRSQSFLPPPRLASDSPLEIGKFAQAAIDVLAMLSALLVIVAAAFSIAVPVALFVILVF